MGRAPRCTVPGAAPPVETAAGGAEARGQVVQLASTGGVGDASTRRRFHDRCEAGAVRGRGARAAGRRQSRLEGHAQVMADRGGSGVRTPCILRHHPPDARVVRRGHFGRSTRGDRPGGRSLHRALGQAFVSAALRAGAGAESHDPQHPLRSHGDHSRLARTNTRGYGRRRQKTKRPTFVAATHPAGARTPTRLADRDGRERRRCCQGPSAATADRVPSSRQRSRADCRPSPRRTPRAPLLTYSVSRSSLRTRPGT